MQEIATSQTSLELPGDDDGDEDDDDDHDHDDGDGTCEISKKDDRKLKKEIEGGQQTKQIYCGLGVCNGCYIVFVLMGVIIIIMGE